MPTCRTELGVSINNSISRYYIVVFDGFCLLMIKLSFTTARDTRYTFGINTKSFIVAFF